MPDRIDPATFYPDHLGKPNYWVTLPWFGFTRQVNSASKFILRCEDGTVKTFTSPVTARRICGPIVEVDRYGKPLEEVQS